MIIALLFLILFAILFPKALRFLFALLFIGMIVALGQAHADQARTKSGLCVGDYSLKQVGEHFVAKSLSKERCPGITIGEDRAINAAPLISALCTNMQDGRTLVSMDDAVLQQAESLGYNHKVCGVKYEIKNFTKRREMKTEIQMVSVY